MAGMDQPIWGAIRSLHLILGMYVSGLATIKTLLRKLWSLGSCKSTYTVLENGPVIRHAVLSLILADTRGQAEMGPLPRKYEETKTGSSGSLRG